MAKTKANARQVEALRATVADDKRRRLAAQKYADFCEVDQRAFDAIERQDSFGRDELNECLADETCLHTQKAADKAWDVFEKSCRCCLQRDFFDCLITVHVPTKIFGVPVLDVLADKKIMCTNCSEDNFQSYLPLVLSSMKIATVGKPDDSTNQHKEGDIESEEEEEGEEDEDTEAQDADIREGLTYSKNGHFIKWLHKWVNEENDDDDDAREDDENGSSSDCPQETVVALKERLRPLLDGYDGSEDCDDDDDDY